MDNYGMDNVEEVMGTTQIDASNEANDMIDVSNDIVEVANSNVPEKKTLSANTKGFMYGVATAAAAGILVNTTMEYVIRPVFGFISKKLHDAHQSIKQKRLMKKIDEEEARAKSEMFQVHEVK